MGTLVVLPFHYKHEPDISHSSNNPGKNANYAEHRTIMSDIYPHPRPN